MAKNLERYLVAPSQSNRTNEMLEGVKAHIEQDPDASVIKASPKRLVVEMGPRTVDELRSKFGLELIIEPDAPLKY